MADLGATSWSETDASNNAAPPDGWPEGMNPSDVNNSARANMGAEKRWWDRSNAVKTTAGTTTAYTLTYDVAAAAYYDGEEFSFVVNATCGAAPTLNINGLGARNIRKFVTSAFINLAASDIVANQALRVRYNLSATAFDIVGGSISVTTLAQSIATSGYTTIPGATPMREQWGQVTVTGGSNSSVTFPVAFSAGPYSLDITANGNTGALSAAPYVASINVGGFTLFNTGVNGTNFLWRAIGAA